MEVVARTGNEAMAEAMRQINPDVVAAYPITPATEIAQIFASYVADGKVDTEYVAVESEHSAMSATLAAAAAGARSMTATSSQGLVYMYEILPITSALRLPIVMPEVNRAISGPINIHCDHSDTMGARDFGWLQIFSENAQEAYDNLLQAVRICEHKDVRLPGMVTTDGFIISHCMERMELSDDKEVKDFIGKYYLAQPLLDVKNPVTVGSIDLQDFYFEHKMPIEQAMINAKKVILEIGAEFGKKFGRSYGFFEEIETKDADYVMVALGSTAGTARLVVKEMREKGIKVGLIKLRVYRPFPAQELAAALKNAKAVAVLDRSGAYNAQGAPLFTEMRSALYDAPNKPMLIDYIYGLGGREIAPPELKKIFEDLIEADKKKSAEPVVRFLGVRE